MITDIQARDIQDWMNTDPDRVTDVMQTKLNHWFQWKRYVNQNPERSIALAKASFGGKKKKAEKEYSEGCHARMRFYIENVLRAENEEEVMNHLESKLFSYSFNCGYWDENGEAFENGTLRSDFIDFESWSRMYETT